jgi:hypothetical protein
MKKGNKLADWFVQKPKKGKPQQLENLINETLLEQVSILVCKLYSEGVKIAIDITKIPISLLSLWHTLENRNCIQTNKGPSGENTCY